MEDDIKVERTTSYFTTVRLNFMYVEDYYTKTNLRQINIVVDFKFFRNWVSIYSISYRQILTNFIFFRPVVMHHIKCYQWIISNNLTWYHNCNINHNMNQKMDLERQT